jgi:hypothetical protein
VDHPFSRSFIQGRDCEGHRLLCRVGILPFKGGSSLLQQGLQPGQHGLISYSAGLILPFSLDGGCMNSHLQTPSVDF